VFIGWQCLYALDLLLVLYWLETLVAQSLHEHTQAVVPESGDVAAPFAVMRPAGDALGIVLNLTIAFGALAFVLLYVI